MSDNKVTKWILWCLSAVFAVVLTILLAMKSISIGGYWLSLMVIAAIMAGNHYILKTK